MIDRLGDLVKGFESAWELVFNKNQPLIARLDGRAFHSFTVGMERPFDTNFIDSMVATTSYLVSETNAKIGYTQSDEITLVWEVSEEQELWFGGRQLKVATNLSSMATLFFFKEIMKRLPNHSHKMPTFDARVWSVPSRSEVIDAIVWRQRDAVRNSISGLANHHFSHKHLQGKRSTEKLQMLEDIGVFWETELPAFTRGTFIRPFKVRLPFSQTELEKLPPKHAARTTPGLMVEHNIHQHLNLVYLLHQMKNPEGFVFEQAPLEHADVMLK